MSNLKQDTEYALHDCSDRAFSNPCLTSIRWKLKDNLIFYISFWQADCVLWQVFQQHFLSFQWNAIFLCFLVLYLVLYYSVPLTPLALSLFLARLSFRSKTWEGFPKIPSLLPTKRVFCYRFAPIIFIFRHYPDTTAGLIPRGFSTPNVWYIFYTHEIISSLFVLSCFVPISIHFLVVI